MIKQKFFVISFLLIIILFSGCSNSVQKEQKKEQTLNLVATDDIGTMDSTGVISETVGTAMNNVFEGLYRIGPNNEPVPGMAKKYDKSKDGKTYTFYLRKNAKWSNGKPVTAQDFIYAWKKALNPETLSPHAYLMDSIENAKKIGNKKSEFYGKVNTLGAKAIDNHTLQVKLEHPTPYFLTLTTLPVYYPQLKTFVEKEGKQYGLEVKNLIFNGPFILDSWNHGASWTYKKNPTYWDAKNVKLDKINVKIVKEVSSIVNLYETNKIDIADLSAEFVTKYRNHDDFETIQKPEMYFIRMNQENRYLKNRNIRKAIDMAWDKKGVENLLKNGSKAAYYLVPENFAFGPNDEDFRNKYKGYNKGGIKKAHEFWEKGLKELGVKKVDLEFLSYDKDQSKEISSYIKNQLEKNLPNLTINIKQMPNKQKLKLEGQQNYDLDFSGWRPEYRDPMPFLNIFVSNGPFNWSDYSNPKYDQLIQKAINESDLKTRFNDLRKAEHILIQEDAVISPMYQAGQARLMKPYVKGYLMIPTTGVSSYKWTVIKN
ncbi:oligopeptide transport system substrate-binding protein [Scopulibacillus darangshiensis]|uniref:Oligopeptide transport system substrate-binding protein n=1 Tax=Scopulibacillus darangshiensis TaxID=442528 RepID=A0A4R2NNU0_9BACL|nr:peptide ABC transporter substrate-binding protein [Scopulibacillus darangshiensis]TCP23443.1 oligopeptide transport system substrate-binding protein [Scopulibacillus darangshiensis]